MNLSLIRIPFKIAYFKYKRSSAGNVYPRFINFITTFECNSRCYMCNIWNKYNSDPQKLKDELSLSEIEEFFLRNKVFLHKLKHIGLTGGEPFLRKDIVGIIKVIRKILPNVRTGIQTNGQMDIIKDKISEIVGFYPDFSLAVSIDGVKVTHDKLRGIKGAYDKAIALIKFSRRLGIKVSSGMTISSLNYREIRDVKRIVEDLGAEFSCFLPEKSGYFNNSNLCYDLNDEMKKEISSTLKELFGYHYYMDNLHHLIEGNKERHLSCYSGYTSLVIDPYGDVKPCLLREESFGNIRNESLQDMLFSQRAYNLRKKLKNCFCWCQCEVSASAVIDPTDAIKWFIFNCRDKKGFLKKLKQKSSNIFI